MPEVPTIGNQAFRQRDSGGIFHNLTIPDDFLGQLGNRIQHALPAFTPPDRKTVRAAASTFRQNPDFDAEQAIPELGVGETLISTLDINGVPGMVDRRLIRPPSSRLGPATPQERNVVLAESFCQGKYEQREDRVSAYEKLQQRRERATREAEQADDDRLYKPLSRSRERSLKEEPPALAVVAAAIVRESWKPWPKAWSAAWAAQSGGKSPGACWARCSRGVSRRNLLPARPQRFLPP